MKLIVIRGFKGERPTWSLFIFVCHSVFFVFLEVKFRVTCCVDKNL